MKFWWTVLLISWPVAAFGLTAGDDVDSAEVITKDTVLFEPDSILLAVSPVTSPINFERRLTMNPTVALVHSMVLPGMGQLGNRRIYKAMLFAGLDAWFLGASVHFGRQASEFRNKYDAATEISTRNEYYSLFEDRKDERNKYRWFAVIISFISMFDAYVDAHLSGFPPKQSPDNLSLGLKPGRDGYPLASITVSF